MSTQTETIQIDGLPLGTRSALEELGRANGKSAEEYLRTIIEGELLSRKSFAEILEPFRRSFEESGMTEEELDTLFQEAREEVYQQRLTRNK